MPRSPITFVAKSTIGSVKDASGRVVRGIARVTPLDRLRAGACRCA
jgi:hypothetical protein